VMANAMVVCWLMHHWQIVSQHIGNVSANALVACWLTCWCVGGVLIVCRPTHWPTSQCDRIHYLYQSGDIAEA